MPIGLVLGGGAPHLPLMSGALLALEEAGLDFEVMSTTGAGMLAGLLYVSPKRLGPGESLSEARRRAFRATSTMGIEDLIYQFMPINFKVFQKPGPVAEALAPAFNLFFQAPRDTREQRLVSDWMALMSATMIPSSLTPWSKGLCQPPSWIEGLVDFDAFLDNLGEAKFRLGSYCIEDRADVSFDREALSLDHCKAALAMPFIYEPYKLPDGQGGEKTYLEGSAFDPLQLNPENVMVDGNIDTIIFFDILGHRKLVDEPRDLTDAWVQSIIAPLTRLAENSLSQFKARRAQHAQQRFLTALEEAAELAETDAGAFKDKRDLIRAERELYELADLLGSADVDLAVFRDKMAAYLRDHDDQKLKTLTGLVDKDYGAFVRQREAYLKERELAAGVPSTCAATHSRRSELLRMPFRRHIPDNHWPKILDWSHSNLSFLFEVGYETGLAFLDHHRERLEGSLGRPLAGTAGQAAAE
ncbi:patatin-like phospholipase family protein [Roseibium sediminicola]|uniref:Patatin-like phospholipase family protein n=1 Tax=Roseibium sediminicola TaxID=2933272 RepID=A0ABT0GP08_9HYPH|nr:patatin-like phospholipase family protein [Roseibium sp. CAU 1639]MCK7611153.1 patatin-like phospholipase family protein [Roseibium sp. CAU 1639]